MSGKGGQTIIIKKIKKGGHGRHGGAWKVAYADFVTAMMAFFLLLWLLTATPVENLEGLADYFSPTMGLKGNIGIGFSGGQSSNTEGWSRSDWTSLGLVFGSPPSGPIIKMPDQDNYIDNDNAPVKFQDIQDKIEKNIENSPETKEFKDSIIIEQTPEGINIQITDKEGRSMFEDNTANLQPYAKQILSKIADIIKKVPNYIQIVGYTSSDYVSKEDYTVWEISVDRANAVRRYLATQGLDPGQVIRVVGKGDCEPLDRDNKNAPVNSRFAITLLRKSVVADYKQPAPDEVILGPEESGLKSYAIDKKKKEKEEGVSSEDMPHKSIVEGEKKKDGEEEGDNKKEKKESSGEKKPKKKKH